MDKEPKVALGKVTNVVPKRSPRENGLSLLVMITSGPQANMNTGVDIHLEKTVTMIKRDPPKKFNYAVSALEAEKGTYWHFF